MGHRENESRIAAGYFPLVTISLVALTVLVYLLQLMHPGGVAGAVDQWGLTPGLVAAGGVFPGTALPAWLGLLTAMFLHSSWTHLLANLWVLAVLGTGLERVLGRWRFLLVYLPGGLLGNAGVVLAIPGLDHALCGASVAAAAVWAAWLCLGRSTLRLSRPVRSGSTAARITDGIIIVVVIGTLVAAAWGWYGYKLLAMATGAGLRVFWSAGFCAHVFGAGAGVLITVTMLPGLYRRG